MDVGVSLKIRRLCYISAHEFGCNVAGICSTEAAFGQSSSCHTVGGFQPDGLLQTLMV